MVRRSRVQAAPACSSDSETSGIHNQAKRCRRDATVYDAVAGRVTTTLPLLDDTYQRSKLRDAILAPEEVLFRRVGAPIRYAEKDIYHAHERLPDAGRDILPDSDMLKAIHCYISHFYAALAVKQKNVAKSVDEQSMDETALIAFGILLEEAGRDALGNRGDMVFTERMAVSDEGHQVKDSSEAIGFLDVVPPPAKSRKSQRTRLEEES